MTFIFGENIALREQGEARLFEGTKLYLEGAVVLLSSPLVNLAHKVTQANVFATRLVHTYISHAINPE